MDFHDLAYGGKKRFERDQRKFRREASRRAKKARQTHLLNSWEHDLPFEAIANKLRYLAEGGVFYHTDNDGVIAGNTRYECPVTKTIGCQLRIEGHNNNRRITFPLARFAYWWHHGVDPGGENFKDTKGVIQIDDRNKKDMRPGNLMLLRDTPERIEQPERRPQKRDRTSDKTRKKGKDKMQNLATSKRMSKFRQDMQLLGIVQAGFQVPVQHKREIQLFADKKKADHYLEICELPVSDEQRITLANRNVVTIPTHTQMARIESLIPKPLSGELKSEVAAMQEHVHGALRARGAMQAVETDEEAVKWASLNVAHSAAAKYYRDFIEWRIAKFNGGG